jgi:phosphotransferase system HPr (HPr) family protein
VLEHEYVVGAAVGLHARPAAQLVRTAARFTSKTVVKNGEKQANAKSLLSVLALGVGYGATIIVTAEGADEDQVMDAMSALFASNFGEPA